MRMLMRVSFPAATSNAAVTSGKLGELLQAVLSDLKPEAAYFTAMGGDRGGFIVFDMQDASDIPAAAEPFFLALGAKVELSPVMTAEDVAQGLAKASAAMQKYG